MLFRSMNYAVATGTANAWIVAPGLAVPSYASGRVLWVIAPATNTNTTVNANVSGLGNRRLKRGDGSDPAIGDLVAGRAYPLVDDGTSLRVVAGLPSEIAAAVAALPPIASRFTDSTPGTRTFTPTVTGWYEIEIVGGGAAGGGGSGTGGGGGGGGGGRVLDYVYLIASTAYTYTVGAGGTTVSPPATGNNGTSTSFVGPAGTLVATGGAGGPGANTGGGGVGGGAGSGSGQSSAGRADAGQGGYAGSPQIAQGGQGGSSPAGGFGGAPSFGGGNAGSAPGGGGSGSTDSQNSGSGANGRLALSRIGS